MAARPRSCFQLAPPKGAEHTCDLSLLLMPVSPGMRIDEGHHWPTTIASLAVGTVFLSLWFWLLPAWLDFRIASPGMARWRWLGVVPCVFGFLVAVRCIWDFGWTGRGTPAPFIPP